jgi:hypothetical protein
MSNGIVSLLLRQFLVAFDPELRFRPWGDGASLRRNPDKCESYHKHKSV